MSRSLISGFWVVSCGLAGCGAEPKPEVRTPAAPATEATSSAMAPAGSMAPASNVAPASSMPPPNVGAGAPSVPAVERVEVAAGATFDLKLPANATTGHHWKVQGTLDPRLALVSDTYEMEPAPAGAEVMVGRGGVAHFVFRGVSAGEAVLVLGYLRPWETDTAEITRTWQVVVK